VATALYRRYRPETFAELIGQSQVTDPLRTALRTDRVNHAYLFSGPRGCGKTTSARILARCLNCAEGPTDTPCGKCASCIELSRDGGGSLDVVEIDAASHNGVDDARDLRERAVFAPARDRYKIFILDEAHMVTPQGFNALLKIVEEPPEHVKFIFATTEPEKVIGTIRSRTHHYPFRLVPPAMMLEYTQTLCEAEGITVAPGVLPLVVRAGGGSVRDTLSLLDQLMAGSEGQKIEYERAVALLGYTNSALLDEVIDSIGARDAASAFTAVDRVIQTGQDPRRFVEDLLERFRDLIVVAATTAEGAAAVLRGTPQDELDRMSVQAHKFGEAELSRAADVANAALTEMTGATSPRLHLELMIARILVPESDESERGALARVERLERRIGLDGDAPSVSQGTSQPRVEPVTPPTARVSAPTVSAGSSRGSDSPRGADPETQRPAETTEQVVVAEAKTVSLQQLRDSWPEILEVVQKAKRAAWMVVFTSEARALEGDVLTVTFPNQTDVDNFKLPQGAGEGVSEYLRKAIVEVLGIRVKFIARVEAKAATASSVAVPPAAATNAVVPDKDAPEPTEPEAEPPVDLAAVAEPAVADPAVDELPVDKPAIDKDGWAVAAIPTSSEPAIVEHARPTVSATPAASRAASSAAKAEASAPQTSASAPQTSPTPAATTTTGETPAASKAAGAAEPLRYGESVVREILGASFIEEHAVAPRVTPREN
jgi:DNA polymerase-3 subunit gamma/tau